MDPGALPNDPAPRATAVLGLTSLAHLVNDGSSFFVPVIAALLGPIRGFSPLDISVLFAVYYGTASGAGLLVGWWADRRGKPAGLLGVGIGLLGVGLFGFYATLAGWGGPLDLPLALGSGVLTGFATSFYHPLGAALLQRTADPARRGTALGVNGAFGSFGRALYPFLFFLAGLAFVARDSILLFATIAFASAATIALGFRALRPAVGVPPSPTAPRAAASLTPPISRLTVVAFVRSGATQGVAVWIPTYLTTLRGVPAGSELGLAVTVMYLGGIVGQPLFGLAANSIDRRGLIAVSSMGAALATLGYLASSGAVSEGLLFLIGVFTFSAFPLLMTLSADYVPGGSSSLANALVFGVGSGGGGAVGPLIVGALAAGGFALLPRGFEVMAAIGLVAAGLVTFLPPGRRRVAAPAFG